MNPFLFWILEQTAEERNESCADEDYTTAGHELLDALGLGTGVIVTVAFHEVDYTPNAETGSDCDDEGLQNSYCALKKCHMLFTFHYL
mgnify:CR=1 FL=1